MFFVILTCLRIWLGPFPLLERAEAQIPDAGLQRKQIVDESRRTNELLSDIKRILETQTLQVRLQGADAHLCLQVAGCGQDNEGEQRQG